MELGPSNPYHILVSAGGLRGRQEIPIHTYMYIYIYVIYMIYVCPQTPLKHQKAWVAGNKSLLAGCLCWALAFAALTSAR